jgi:hypothetical protein
MIVMFFRADGFVMRVICAGDLLIVNSRLTLLACLAFSPKKFIKIDKEKWISEPKMVNACAGLTDMGGQ